MLNKIVEFFVYFWNQAQEFFSWVFDSIFHLLSEFVYAIFDAVLSFIESIVSAINFAEITALQSLQSWTGLPDQVIWLLNYINLPTCLAIILSAYAIRLVLNFIPAAFTRI